MNCIPNGLLSPLQYETMWDSVKYTLTHMGPMGFDEWLETTVVCMVLKLIFIHFSGRGGMAVWVTVNIGVVGVLFSLLLRLMVGSPYGVFISFLMLVDIIIAFIFKIYDAWGTCKEAPDIKPRRQSIPEPEYTALPDRVEGAGVTKEEEEENAVLDNAQWRNTADGDESQHNEDNLPAMDSTDQASQPKPGIEVVDLEEEELSFDAPRRRNAIK